MATNPLSRLFVRSQHSKGSIGDGLSPSLMDVEKELFGLKRQMGSFYAKGLYKDALSVAETLRDSVEEHLGKDNSIYASSLNNVALMTKHLGNHEESLKLYTEALHVYYKSVGREHTSYASTLSNLGALYKTYGFAPPFNSTQIDSLITATPS